MTQTPNTQRMAVVGYGGWGPNLARVLARAGWLFAIYETDPANRARAQAAHPDVLCHATWRPDVASVQAVVLATPAHTHAAMVREALAHGLDVFVEKPLALKPHEAHALALLAQGAGRVLMVGHLLCYHPAIEVIGETLAAGTLGPLRLLVAERHNFGIVRTNEDVIFSLGPHDVAVMLHLTHSVPTHVAAQGQRLLGTDRLDACQLQLQFAEGYVGRISLSWLHPIKTQSLIVQGAHAALVFDDVHKTLQNVPMAVDTDAQGRPVARRASATAVPYASDEPLERELRAFAQALTTREPPVTHGAHGAEVVAVLQAAQASLAQGGRPVALATP